MKSNIMFILFLLSLIGCKSDNKSNKKEDVDTESIRLELVKNIENGHINSYIRYVSFYYNNHQKNGELLKLSKIMSDK